VSCLFKAVSRCFNLKHCSHRGSRTLQLVWFAQGVTHPAACLLSIHPSLHPSLPPSFRPLAASFFGSRMSQRMCARGENQDQSEFRRAKTVLPESHCKLPCFRGLGERPPGTCLLGWNHSMKRACQLAPCTPARPFILVKLSSEKLPQKSAQTKLVCAEKCAN
jgi:hypothetical protein